MPTQINPLQELLAVVSAVVDESGALVSANRGFMHLANASDLKPGTPVGRYFIQPDFDLLANSRTGDGVVYSGLLTLGNYVGMTRTLRGQVRREDGKLHLLAEYDIEDLERLSHALSSLNSKYAQSQYQLTQTNLEMQKLLLEVEQHRDALRVSATAFEAHEGMAITDANQTYVRVNRAFTQITGYSEEEILGRTPSLMKSGHHDRDFYTSMWRDITQLGSWRGEIWDRKKTGEIFPVWLTITAIKDEAGHTTHFVATATDITERKSEENEIHSLAFYDALTELPNRRLLVDRLEKAIVTCLRRRQLAALLFLDLDKFKSINDTHGHDAGDLLLVQVANRLKSCVREVDTVARLGGDEFVVMLEDLSADPALASDQSRIVGNKILAAMGQDFDIKGLPHRNTVSIGVTLLGFRQESVDEPLKRADVAMYQSKAAGRNTLRFVDAD